MIATHLKTASCEYHNFCRRRQSRRKAPALGKFLRASFPPRGDFCTVARSSRKGLPEVVLPGHGVPLFPPAMSSGSMAFHHTIGAGAATRRLDTGAPVRPGFLYDRLIRINR